MWLSRAATPVSVVAASNSVEEFSKLSKEERIYKRAQHRVHRRIAYLGLHNAKTLDASRLMQRIRIQMEEKKANG